MFWATEINTQYFCFSFQNKSTNFQIILIIMLNLMVLALAGIYYWGRTISFCQGIHTSVTCRTDNFSMCINSIALNNCRRAAPFYPISHICNPCHRRLNDFLHLKKHIPLTVINRSVNCFKNTLVTNKKKKQGVKWCPCITWHWAISGYIICNNN